MEVYNYIRGFAKRLNDVNDPVFSEKMMGEGLAVVPLDGNLVSPVSGKITMVFPTGHALGIETSDGHEILLHIGIDTVEMNGEGFESLVEAGDKVEVGTPLIKFDLELIKKQEYETDVIMVLTNSKTKVLNIEGIEDKQLELGQILMHIE